MRYWILLLFFGVIGKCFAQEKAIEGIVYDKVTRERIARVNIQNLRTKQSVYNNLKAEFKINALADDQLIVSKLGYFTDTVKLQTGNSLIVYLRPTATQLKQVNVRDTLQSPQKRYMALKQEYSKAYGSNAYRDPLSLIPGAGAGISIDAIWNSISREGRNAAKLQATIENDYHESLIDYRFNKTFVGNITGLKEPALTDFMQKYRPSYYAVMNDSQYEFISSIRTSYRRYLRNQKAFALPQLKQNTIPAPTLYP
jgi:hypothetical protein